MGRRPAAQPNWEYRVAKKDIHKLRPMLDVLKSLLRYGLLGADIHRNFLSHRVQPLRRLEMTMWRYPRPGCPTELMDTEVDARVRKLLALGARRPSAPSLASLREGVGSQWVSPFKLVAAQLCWFLPLLTPATLMLQGLGCVRSDFGEAGGQLRCERKEAHVEIEEETHERCPSGCVGMWRGDPF
jgi:hypothetical protein